VAGLQLNTEENEIEQESVETLAYSPFIADTFWLQFLQDLPAFDVQHLDAHPLGKATLEQRMTIFKDKLTTVSPGVTLPDWLLAVLATGGGNCTHWCLRYLVLISSPNRPVSVWFEDGGDNHCLLFVEQENFLMEPGPEFRCGFLGQQSQNLVAITGENGTIAAVSIRNRGAPKLKFYTRRDLALLSLLDFGTEAHCPTKNAPNKWSQ